MLENTSALTFFVKGVNVFMNNLKKTLLSIAAVAAIFGATSTEAKAQGVLNDVLKRMDTAYKSLSTLRSNVKMEKTDSVLGETDTYEGTVIYVPKKGRDANIRIDWVKPSNETLAVVGGKYLIYKQSTKQAFYGSVNDAKGDPKTGSSLAFLNMSKAQLKANYDIALIGEETVASGDKTWHLRLTPKTKGKQKQADVWVDTNGFPLQSKVTENNNDTTTVSLSKLEKNVTIDLSLFKVQLPKDVAMVKQ
jgi:outer membrane lipoprotein-sorting protein